MRPEVIAGWLIDVDILSRPADFYPSSYAPPRTKRPFSAAGQEASPRQSPISANKVDDAFSPPFKRQRRAPLGAMDSNRQPVRRTSPRKQAARGGEQSNEQRDPSPKKVESRGRPGAPGKENTRQELTHSEEDGTADDEHDVHDPSIDNDPQATPRAPRSTATSQYSIRLRDATCLPASTASASSRARSTSPIKRADDLLKLRKPVRWLDLSAGDLTKRVAKTRNEAAGLLLEKIKRVVRSGRGYLPEQLRDPLQDDLGLADDDGDKFAERDPVSLDARELELGKSKARRLLGKTASDAELRRIVQVLQPLERELEELQSIVENTNTFKTTPHAEAAWNEQIHGPMLELALLHQPAVGFENVTRANIARPFLPQATAEIGLATSSKMIDYAMVLKDDAMVHEDDLILRIRNFVARLDPPVFNQTNYAPLSNWPTGIFIETKVDSSNGWAEGKAQLGFWLAAWFKRVSMFPSYSHAPRLPFLPVLLVVGDKWELHFAFDDEADFQVCGGLDVGGTGDLDAAYRLLAVLRILAKEWMATEFRTWVEGCI